ncbi:alpha/beta-Hydrolase [Glarea lozoyensis ATCC 20868]|uniref:Alpha/beta-Hydrolase n=1 Tax=Glarea lozoyensis (strain ATCC 20868 / MF5171) TaxID=1116229 RepID=S3DC87_GLAL2|nr:alpha/beta-Hydrolase [Glarea lozoyensis ATCC 20868]EPE29621.1 alpha/beta-Hydrolase [Glarea lozoyensis ATCC 20868]
MSTKPTIILVPGAWHSETVYDQVVSLLSEQGYKSIAVALKSTSGDSSTTPKDDIDGVRDAILGETNQGRDVVVTVHSFGGIVGASAIKGLTAKQDNSSGRVVGLIMLASGFAQTGKTFMSGLDNKPPPFWVADTTTGFATLVVDPLPLFYHDLSAEEGAFWVKKLLKQSLKPMFEGGEYVYAGWKDVPVVAVISTDDRSFPVDAQKFFAQSAKDAGGDVTIKELFSSHSLMLSKPKEVVEIMTEAVSMFLEKTLSA